MLAVSFRFSKRLKFKTSHSVHLKIHNFSNSQLSQLSVTHVIERLPLLHILEKEFPGLQDERDLDIDQIHH
jgi:hypothetical protein